MERKAVFFWGGVRVGSVAAKVYYTPHGQRDFFTVVYWVDDKRKRMLLATKEAAIEAAKGKCKDFNKGKLVAPDLSATELLACSRALNIIQPTGLAIDEVANLFWEYYKILPNVPPRIAGADYARRNAVNAEPKKVMEMMEKMLSAKKADGLSGGYLRHLRYDLEKFRQSVSGELGRDHRARGGQMAARAGRLTPHAEQSAQLHPDAICVRQRQAVCGQGP